MASYGGAGERHPLTASSSLWPMKMKAYETIIIHYENGCWIFYLPCNLIRYCIIFQKK